jgi:hypothetical protein
MGTTAVKPWDPAHTCAECRWLGSEANPLNVREPLSTCHRNPPTLLLVGPGNLGSGFPPTRPEWGCGEWERHPLDES